MFVGFVHNIAVFIIYDFKLFSLYISIDNYVRMFEKY